MTESIGKVYTISSILGNLGITLSPINFSYPVFSLELVAKRYAAPTIGLKGGGLVEIQKNGDLLVRGDTIITTTELKELTKLSNQAAENRVSGYIPSSYTQEQIDKILNRIEPDEYLLAKGTLLEKGDICLGVGDSRWLTYSYGRSVGSDGCTCPYVRKLKTK